MSLNFDVIVDTPEHSIDMKTGLDTLQGVSEATRCIAETLLNGQVAKRLSHKSKVRTMLKQNFKGSYGQVFSLEIFDEELKKRFNKIGKEYFVEIMMYFISEALYLESKILSTKSQSIVDNLGDDAEGLIKQLRVSSLESIHEIAEKFNHKVQLRYRKSRFDQTTLATFDSETVHVLHATETNEKYDITAAVTRLNINTGNGRLLIDGADETVAFGFGIGYWGVAFGAKKKFSENLDYNNGLPREKWNYLKMSVVPVKLKDGKIVKYIVKAFYND